MFSYYSTGESGNTKGNFEEFPEMSKEVYFELVKERIACKKQSEFSVFLNIFNELRYVFGINAT